MLRRLGDALRRQDPATVLIELLVLVIGIALGLQVDDWNAQRQQRQLEQNLIERLTEDFEQIDERLSDSLNQYDGFLESILFVRRQVLSEASPTSETRAQFLSALGDVFASRIPAGRSPTYVEMLSTGVFRIVSDDELKRRLVEYDHRQNIAMTGWGTLRDQSLAFSAPIMYAITLVAPDENESNLNPGDFDFDRMRGDPEFDGALGVQISVQANNKELQIAQREAARDVLERLAVQAQ
jgi:hypothetical protein